MNASTITRLPLERRKKIYDKEFPWAACAPFVDNSRGVLIHRPRFGSTYNLHRTGPHIGIMFWCGMGVSGGAKNLTFLAAPPEGRILCERCESAAVSHGLPSADELAGRHVHKGRTVAVVTCCNNGDSWSTQTCHECGSIAGPKGQTGLNEREWDCPDCGAHHLRDVNAAINIRERGLALLAGETHHGE